MSSRDAIPPEIHYIFRGDDQTTLSIKTDSESHAYYRAIRFFNGGLFKLEICEVQG